MQSTDTLEASLHSGIQLTAQFVPPLVEGLDIRVENYRQLQEGHGYPDLLPCDLEACYCHVRDLVARADEIYQGKKRFFPWSKFSGGTIERIDVQRLPAAAADWCNCGLRIWRTPPRIYYWSSMSELLSQAAIWAQRVLICESEMMRANIDFAIFEWRPEEGFPLAAQVYDLKTLLARALARLERECSRILFRLHASDRYLDFECLDAEPHDLICAAIDARRFMNMVPIEEIPLDYQVYQNLIQEISRWYYVHEWAKQVTTLRGIGKQLQVCSTL